MTVSVVIPFYNLADYVRETLASVTGAIGFFNARGPTNAPRLAVEVICVDDGSTDGTGALLDEFAEESKLKVQEGNGKLLSSTSTSNFNFTIIHQPNGGEGAARNAGLGVATGEWVTFLDGDDVWLPTVLAEFATVAERHPAANIVGFRFLPFEDGARPPAASPAAEAEREFDLHGEIPSEAILDLGVFPTFFRRERFRDIAFSALPLGADRLYVAQCLSRADRIVMSPAGVHGYRVRAGSMARLEWNERKIRSMVDFAAGSLAAFSASGRRVGRKGAAYLGDVLLSVTPRKIRRMAGDRTSVRRHWIRALSQVEGRLLTLLQRIRRAWFCRWNAVLI